METALLFLVAYLLGIWSCVILGALILLHHRRPEAPVLRRRRYRDLPVPEVKSETVVEERPIYMYGIMGLSDEE